MRTLNKLPEMKKIYVCETPVELVESDNIDDKTRQAMAVLIRKFGDAVEKNYLDPRAELKSIPKVISIEFEVEISGWDVKLVMWVYTRDE